MDKVILTTFIKALENKKITIDDIPSPYREAVEDYLKDGEGE